MSRPRVWAARLRALFFRSQLERELDDEIRFHLEMQADRNIQAGMDPQQASQAAARSFGGVMLMKETHRERRAFHPLETIAQDVRYALRMMRKNPGFTTVAVLSLAIGIGANCAVFSAADAYLLRPLPVPHPGDVMTVGSSALIEGFGEMVASYPEYVDIRSRSKSFDGLVGFTNNTAAVATAPDELPSLRLGLLVSGNFFSVLGVEPQLGRTFRPEEDQVPGRDAVLILGHDFWQSQFGGDRSILGRTMHVNGVEFTVIGVAPPDFTGLDQFARFQFYAPLMMWPRLSGDPAASRLASTQGPQVRPLEARGLRALTIKGRLKPGVTLSAAQSEVSVIAKDLERAYPDTNRNRGLAVRTELQTRIARDPEDAGLIAMLAVLSAAVLLVACANVAGLLMSLAPARGREIAVRLAIGAGRRRVARQLFTESVLLGGIGGVLGLGVGYAGVMWGNRFRIPTDLPIAATIEMNRRALVASLIVALGSALLFGLAPAIGATRTDLTTTMKATDVAGVGRRRWGRAVLVGGQVAGAVVLLVVALFVYRGFQQRLIVGPGYRTDHLLLMSFDPGLAGYSDAQSGQFFEQVAERARFVPGVTSAALASTTPMDGARPITIVPEGFQFPDGKENATVPGAMVDEHYFETLKLTMVRGRRFRATDTADAPKVAVVNERLAAHYWPGQDPVGKRFRLNDGERPWVEIVGLAKTSKYFFIMEPPSEFLYLPYKQRPQRRMVLVAESAGDAASLAEPLREMVRGLDAHQPIYNVRTMEDFYNKRVVVALSVVGGFIVALGLMGLALAIVGLYGLVAYAVSRRTREIGIRMAIGARRWDVQRMVLRQGVGLAIAGLVVGLIASAGASRGLGAVFPGGPAGDGRTDFVAFPLVAAAVLAVTLLAAYIPARRASRINPTEALRQE